MEFFLWPLWILTGRNEVERKECFQSMVETSESFLLLVPCIVSVGSQIPQAWVLSLLSASHAPLGVLQQLTFLHHILFSAKQEPNWCSPVASSFPSFIPWADTVRIYQGPVPMLLIIVSSLIKVKKQEEVFCFVFFKLRWSTTSIRWQTDGHSLEINNMNPYCILTRAIDIILI